LHICFIERFAARHYLIQFGTIGKRIRQVTDTKNFAEVLEAVSQVVGNIYVALNFQASVPLRFSMLISIGR
jgi:hypothetical protein